MAESDRLPYVRGRLDLRQSLSVAVALAETVASIHDHGILHKDLKTINVLVVCARVRTR